MLDILQAMADSPDLLLVLKQYGPLAGAVVFFLWRDMRREELLNKRIEHLENRQSEILLPLVEETTKVIAKNTTVMERLEKALDR